MSVNIHGKEYITVAERLELAKTDIVEISTEVLQYTPTVVIKATVTLKDKRKASGISGANPNKLIEKMSPYEVAETSALGRALGFLGYGIVEGIATADEMRKVEHDPTDDWKTGQQIEDEGIGCTCETKGKFHSKNCPMFKK